MIIRMKNIEWTSTDEQLCYGPRQIDFHVKDDSLSIDDQYLEAMDFASDLTGYCLDSCDFEILVDD